MSDPVLEREAEIIAEQPYDASDRKTINAAKKKAANEEKKRLQVVQALMQHKDGRKWIYDELVACKVFSTPFMHGSPDGTAFQCGMQNRGLKLLSDITTADPDGFVQMMKEAKQ